MVAEPTLPVADSPNQTGDEPDRVALLRLSAAEASMLPAKLQWTLAGWYRTRGDLEAAAAMLEAAAIRGESGKLIEERGRLAFAAGRSDEALGLLEERVALAPSATSWVALARLRLETGDTPTAVAIAADLCRDFPDHATVGALAADVARVTGDLETARAYHEGVLGVRPDNVAALLGLARIALQSGNVIEARGFLDRALDGAETATVGQLLIATAVAELCDQPVRAAALRLRATGIEQARTAALVREVESALGRPLVATGLGVGARPIGGAAIGPSDAEMRVAAVPPRRGTAATTLVGSAPAPSRGWERAPAAPAMPEAVVDQNVPEAPPVPESPPEVEVPVEPRVLELLRRDFGHESLRPGQAAAIANVLAGRDTLAIMPTGAGKSLTFQLPAQLLEGTTLVISPLIALMKDQVDGLPPAVRARTALINSTLSADEQRRALDELADGVYKLVYVAPERLRQAAFLRALRAAGVALVVVDEAHCISLWGHDFRPDYLSIPASLPEMGNPPVLAITATATPRMADAIAAGFGRDLDRVLVSVFRPNLVYEAYRVANREEKVAKVLDICRAERGAGIVYVSSRKDTEALAGLLRDRGVGAIPYHAGLDQATRARNQERFMQGQVRVVVATVAFGMGVDKANVRFVVHLSPPKSLEAYAQESGRAGRDGQRARCVLLVAPSDQASMSRLARRDELDLDTLRRAYAGVKRQAVGRWALVDPATLLPPLAFDDDPDDAPDPRVALNLLEQAQLVHRYPDAPVSYSLRWVSGAGAAGTGTDDDEQWRRFVSWSGLGEAGGLGVTIRTAEACTELNLRPDELGRLMGARPELSVREGTRLVCLELRPVASDAGARLSNILTRAHEEARQRIAQVIAYAAGGRCRHVLLANHLGEALVPCQTSCDVCLGTAGPVARGRAGGADGAPPRRSEPTAGDALAVLEAVRSLPFQMGKTGLGKLLAGSVESRVRADRTPAFGALAGFSRGKIEGLIDRLVEDGFLDRDLNHEYKIVTLTERGTEAGIDDLAAYEGRQRPSSAVSATVANDDEELDADGLEILARLETWRRDRASRDAVPPYVVAHNSMLRDLALVRPTTPDALGRIKGFGPARVEKYGDEVLAVIAGA